MKKIAVLFLLASSSTLAQGNPYISSSTNQQLENIVKACAQTARAWQTEEVKSFINSHEGQLNQNDIDAYASDLDVVVRMKTRNCAAAAINR